MAALIPGPVEHETGEAGESPAATLRIMHQTFPKRGKHMRTKRDADKALDRAESQRVRRRSRGRCEVQIHLQALGGLRCNSPAVHVMHLIGGRGKRGRGLSALAVHKLHSCAQHHREIDGGIGGKKLKRIGGGVPMWTDWYERVAR